MGYREHAHRLIAAVGLVLSLSLVTASGASAIDFNLAPGSPFGTGAGTSQITAGQVNSATDSHLDAVVADTASHTISVLLGNGHGQLSAAVGSPVATSGTLTAFALGDVNGDGKADVVAVNRNAPGSADVLLGNGLGRLTPAIGSPITIGGDPGSIVLGDFNGDHHLDFATSNEDEDSVRVLLGNGSGGFSAAAGSPFAAGNRAYDVTAGDFDGDDNLDLAVARLGQVGGGGVNILLGDGHGGFGAAAATDAGQYRSSVVAADFDGDDDLDLADTAQVALPPGVGTHIGDGHGGFTIGPGSPYDTTGQGETGTEAVAIEPGDVNGDGHVDLATANDRSGASLLLGDGNGGFARPSTAPFPTGAPAYSVALGDFDEDGFVDIATANHQHQSDGTPVDGSVSVLLNSPPDTSLTAGPSGVTRKRDARVEFTSRDDTATFECRLDDGDWAACTSPKAYRDLPAGTHTAYVRAVSNGRADPTPATLTWTIDLTTPPVAEISAVPNPVMTTDQVTLDASRSHDSLDGSVVRYEWDIDGDGSFELDTGTTPSVTRVYFERGIVHPRVRVTIDAGASNIGSLDLDVRLHPPPGDLGVTINHGARYTNDPKVTISPVWPTLASSVKLSGDGGFGGARTLPVDADVPWTLESDEAGRLPQTVYARFVGGESGPETYQDDIILDTTPPEVRSARLASPRTIKLRAADGVSGVSRVQAGNGHSHTAALPFKARLRVHRGFHPTHVRVRDRAGNWSRWHKVARGIRRKS